MANKPVYLSIIPARGGSKGIPGKNITTVGGKPLLVHSIETSLSCPHIAKTAVSTDDNDIASVARDAGAHVIMRPAQLAADDTPTEPVLLHVLDELAPEFKPDVIILLQPTSPYRPMGLLSNCIRRFEETGADSLLTVCENPPFLWKLEGSKAIAEYDYRTRPRRQDIARSDIRYFENGNVYITRTTILRETGNRLGGKITAYPMGIMASMEIDTPEELKLLDAILRSRKR